MPPPVGMRPVQSIQIDLHFNHHLNLIASMTFGRAEHLDHDSRWIAEIAGNLDLEPKWSP